MAEKLCFQDRKGGETAAAVGVMDYFSFRVENRCEAVGEPGGAGR